MKDINNLFNKLLEKFLPKFIKSIKIDYSIGSAMSIVNAKKEGKKTKLNPLSLTKKDQEANIEIIESLIKDVNSEVAKKISYIVNKGITERMSTLQVAEELKQLDIEETYKNRLKTIAQNESFRIMNSGSFNTAKRLGATRKWIYNPMDGKTADDSKISDSKYGSPEKSIPIDESFVYTYKGKTREFMYGSDRVNDRSITSYLFD